MFRSVFRLCVCNSLKTLYSASKLCPKLLRNSRMFRSSAILYIQDQNTQTSYQDSNTNEKLKNDLSSPVNNVEQNEQYSDDYDPNIQNMRNPFWNIENDYKSHCTTPDDVPHFIDDIGPAPEASFNLAAFADKSSTLQKFVELGVDLSKFEEQPKIANMILSLDFEKDVKPYIQFLHDKNVPADEIGYVLSKNPMLLKEDLENLQIRVNYLLSKKFDNAAISRIISNNPRYLLHNTKFVDKRLGFFQKTFALTGDEVRFLITKYPKLVSHRMGDLLDHLHVLKQHLGFADEEIKQIVLMKPKIVTIGIKNLEDRFNIIHNVMGLSHSFILTYPGIFLKRGFHLEQRHKYLTHLGRAQYDPKKPGYIPIKDIAATTDDIFCKRCTKTSVVEYNEFLKTL